MDVYKCKVALGGNIGMTVNKDGCSVADLVMLRYLHGDVSVTEIEKTSTKPGDSTSERDYLNSVYRTPKVAEVFGPYGDLPMKIAEAKIPESYFADPPKKATKKTTKKSTKSKK